MGGQTLIVNNRSGLQTMVGGGVVCAVRDLIS